jgi:hypothetical protein
MLESGVELIELEHNVDYTPTFVSTDKRAAGGVTTIGYYQIGDLQQYGFARGPVFKVEFVNLSSAGASYVKIWGIDNLDIDAPVYPITYLAADKQPVIHVYLKKFIFCDSAGNPVTPSGEYTVVGYKKRVMPMAW